MIKPKRSIRTDLPYRVSVRSRPLDKGWGVGGGGGKEWSQKKLFSVWSKNKGGRGVAGSTPESHRIFMNG